MPEAPRQIRDKSKYFSNNNYLEVGYVKPKEEYIGEQIYFLLWALCIPKFGWWSAIRFLSSSPKILTTFWGNSHCHSILKYTSLNKSTNLDTSLDCERSYKVILHRPIKKFYLEGKPHYPLAVATNNHGGTSLV